MHTLVVICVDSVVINAQTYLSMWIQMCTLNMVEKLNLKKRKSEGIPNGHSVSSLHMEGKVQ